MDVTWQQVDGTQLLPSVEHVYSTDPGLLFKYAHWSVVGQTYRDGKALSAEFAAAPAPAGTAGASSQPQPSGTMQLTSPTPASLFLSKFGGSFVNTGGIDGWGSAWLAAVSKDPHLRWHYSQLKKQDMQQELQSLNQLHKAVMELGAHMQTSVITGTFPVGVAEFKRVVFDATNTSSHNATGLDGKLLNLQNALAAAADHLSTKNSKACSIREVTEAARSLRYVALYKRRNEKLYLQLSGVLHLVTSWRDLVEFIMFKQLPYLAAAIEERRVHEEKMKLLKSSEDKESEKQAFKNRLHALRDSMPALPECKRAVPYGMHAGMPEPAAEDDRVEAPILESASQQIECLRDAGWFATRAPLSQPAAADGSA